jgi:hypothetical protein
MQELIADLIRWVGYVVLRVVTLGRYTGGTTRDELNEGAFGLGLVALVSYVIYAIST